MASDSRRLRPRDRDDLRRPNVAITPGDALEYRVARLFASMGYFVRRSREIFTEAYLDRATDLDVLAIKYLPPFRREVQIVECKGGANRPLDRVFWLAGVKAYTSADFATLVRDSVKWNIKDFAREAGVEILDLPALSAIEKHVGIDHSDWPGWIDQRYFAQRAPEWNKFLRSDGASAELYQFLNAESRFHQPFPAIIFLLFHARRLTKVADSEDEQAEFFRYLLADTISHLLMFFMVLAESCYGLTDKDVDGYIYKGLKYGSLDPRLADRLMSLARNVTDQVLFERLGQKVDLDNQLFTFPEPTNVVEITDVIRLLLSDPLASSTTVPLADYVMFEAYVRRKAGRMAWLNTVFRHIDRPKTYGLLGRIMRILLRSDAIPESLYVTIGRTTSLMDGREGPKSLQISFFEPS